MGQGAAKPEYDVGTEKKLNQCGSTGPCNCPQCMSGGNIGGSVSGMMGGVMAGSASGNIAAHVGVGALVGGIVVYMIMRPQKK